MTDAALRPLVRPTLFVVLFTLLPLWQLRPLWSAVLAFALVAYRLWLDWRDRPLPPRWILLMAQVAAVVAVWTSYHSFFGDEAGGTLLSLLVGLKVYELRRKRDFFITGVLCFLVLMSYLLVEQGLMITGFLLLDVLLVVTLLYGLEAEHWTWTSWRPFLRPALSLVLKSLPLLVLIFLLFPRFSTGFGTTPKNTARTGVTDSLEPGSVGRLIQSDELVFRATFLTGFIPPRNQLYWRGAVLDAVDGLKWSRSQLPVHNAVVMAPLNPDVEIFLEPGSERFLFAPEGTRQLGFPNDFQNHRVRRREGGIFELRQSLQNRDRYVLETGGEGDSDEPGPRFLAVNEPESRRMTAFLKGFSGHPAAETVNAVLEYFRGNHFVYSLQPPRVNTVDQFLFKTREGFCEHYASAMATILRRLRIPARVVIGFQGGTPSLFGNYITVRGQDAHAWVEYFDANRKSWRRADPTAEVAPSRLALGGESYLQADPEFESTWMPRGWLTARLRLRALFDEVEANWTSFLLGFDLAWQRNLLSRLGMGEVLFRALPVFLLLSLVLCLALLYFFEAQRREPLTHEERLYRRLQRILKRQGIERAAFEGPLTLFARVQAQDAALAAALEPALAPLVLARFADQSLTRESTQQVKRALRALRRRRPR